MQPVEIDKEVIKSLYESPSNTGILEIVKEGDKKVAKQVSLLTLHSADINIFSCSPETIIEGLLNAGF